MIEFFQNLGTSLEYLTPIFVLSWLVIGNKKLYNLLGEHGYWFALKVASGLVGGLAIGVMLAIAYHADTFGSRIDLIFISGPPIAAGGAVIGSIFGLIAYCAEFPIGILKKTTYRIGALLIPLPFVLASGIYAASLEPTPPPADVLIETVERRDHELLKELVDRPGAEINGFHNGEAPIHVAARIGDRKAILILAQANAKLRLKTLKSQKSTPLHIAVRHNNVLVAEALLENAVPPNEVDGLGRTALHIAVLESHLNMVKLLLEKISPVRTNRLDKQGLAPLHHAVQMDSRPIIEVLLKHGIDIEAKTRNGRTALHLAAASGLSDTVELLLRQGASAQVADADSVTPLHLAAGAGETEICKQLLDHSAKPNTRTKTSGETPLHVALINNRAEVAMLLISHGADPSIRPRDNTPTLFLSVKPIMTEVAIELMTRGADPRERNPENQTILHIASGIGNIELLRELLTRRLEVAAVDNDGMTALHAAVDAGQMEVVKLLLAHKAPLEAENLKGDTPLMLAARVGHEDIVERLLAAGAQLEAAKPQGATAIDAAAQAGHVTVIRLLLSEGASFFFDPKFTKDALEVLAEELLAIQTLLKKLAYYNGELDGKIGPISRKAIRSFMAAVDRPLVGDRVPGGLQDSLREVQDLFETVANDKDLGESNALRILRAVYGNGDTLLHQAARFGGKDTGKQLLAIGLDIDALNLAGETPLVVAVRQGSPDFVAFLLDKGADAGIPDAKGVSVLRHAIRRDDLQMVELLLRYGLPMGIETFRYAKIHAPLKVYPWLKKSTELAQAALKRLEFDVGEIDGQPGPKTHSALTLYRAGLSEGSQNESPQGGYSGEADVSLLIQTVDRLLVDADCMDLVKSEPLPKKWQDQISKCRDARDANGFNALHIGSLRGHLPLVQSSIKNGFNVDLTTSSDQSALHLAAAAESLASLHALLAAKADLSIHDSEGWTPLHHAIDSRNLESVQLLVNAGADINTKADDGRSPFRLIWQLTNNDIDDVIVAELVRLIENIQSKLKELGHFQEPIDGLPGPNTFKAIDAFENRLGCEATGRIDIRLLALLAAEIEGKQRTDDTPC